jgi:phosphohistidine phosphatase SixA
MKFINFLFIIFITINSSVKADLNQNLINELKQGGKLIFIRHAYAPGGGDPKNFDINDCKTQRNLSNSGRNQAKKIGSFFKDNNILIDKVYSSEWCRCKETASIAFNDFETKSFLNSFFSSQFAKNKDSQMKKLKRFISNWNDNKNLVFVTHYVVISESLNYAPSSGEIVISNKYFKVIDTIEIEY